ncbi:MAG: beta-ketoacyl-ACP synthase III [Clostridium sp.]
MKEVKISGIGAYSPSNVVTNDDLSKIVDTNDQWITERTGIRERRISTSEDTSDMAFEAAKVALDRANISASDIDLIIVATCSPDMSIPSVACLVQDKIGAENATTFDLNAACSGFLYGVQVAQSMIKTNDYKHALVIGSETLSKVLDWNDRGTCVLFGDGAGAAVLSVTDEIGVIKTYSKGVGSKWKSLTLGAFDLDNPYVEEKIERNKKVSMNGREVFKFATSVIIDGINKVLDGTEYSLEDIKYIVPHQANTRIIDYSAKKLGVDGDKFYKNLDRFGNTSSASVPLALNEMYEKGLISKGDILILVGFGGGLTYASALIKW